MFLNKTGKMTINCSYVYLFIFLFQNLIQRLQSYSPQVILAWFVNKVLLKHGHAHVCKNELSMAVFVEQLQSEVVVTETPQSPQSLEI